MHLLTFEKSTDSDELIIHADSDGLKILIKSLKQLLEKTESGKTDHDHLMTDKWGGWELSNAPQQSDGSTKIIHHVKIYGWPDR